MANQKLHSLVLLMVSFCPEIWGQTGHVAHGVGAVNQSMAGAGTALPLDATGALFWNPASIVDLKSPELDINGDVALLHGELSSSVQANILAPGIPPQTFSGSSRNRTNIIPLASIAWVQPSSGKWTYGFLAANIGGFGFHYKNDPPTPITSAPPPRGVGVGEIRTSYILIQLAPTLAGQISNRLSFGIAPNVDIASLKAVPFPFTSPDDSNHDGFPTFPPSNRAWSVGAGVQGGLYYRAGTWQLGVSVKSPQWFRAFKFDSRNELGESRSFKFRLDYPMIATAGIACSGARRVKWDGDVRYIDYQRTRGFDQTGFDPSTGAVRGLGWRSIWVFATGFQVQASDRLSIRAGYGFNQNPIAATDTFFNPGSPLITEHQGNVGFSYRLNPRLQLSIAYHHAFENSIQGQFRSPLGSVPGTSVRSDFGTDVFVLSVGRQF